MRGAEVRAKKPKTNEVIKLNFLKMYNPSLPKINSVTKMHLSIPRGDVSLSRYFRPTYLVLSKYLISVLKK